MVTLISERSLEIVSGIEATVTTQFPQPSILEPQKRKRVLFAGLVDNVGEYFWKLKRERLGSHQLGAVSPREKAWVDAYLRYGPF